MYRIGIVLTLLGLSLSAAPVQASTVKITPLGSHDGEFCRFDRALVLEDPDGTRLLYDAGRTVAGADDPRLGRIDALLVSHMHGDHVGDRRIPTVNAGECGKPDLSKLMLPESNTVAIAMGKSAAIVTGSEMPKFFAARLRELGGDPKQSQLVRFGGSRKVGGVTVTTVPAAHSNGIGAGFLPKWLAERLKEAGVTAYAGPPTGYVLTFSNGLVAYLSGDTGITAEQKLVVGDYYKAGLVVINIGDTFTTGPREAAHVVNELISPRSVIASHANEVATSGGKLLPGTRTEQFSNAAHMPVHLPISGRIMEFDGDGSCVSGCSGR
ncbi:MAG: MBL fold metallo-hydrolase [Gammaproteobacteria bacterium]